MEQEEKIEQNNTEEENKPENNTKSEEIIYSNNETATKIRDMNQKFLISKNEFFTKLNKFITEVFSNYDEYINEINKKSEEIINDSSKSEEYVKKYLFGLENAFQNIEYMQNCILEENENLNKYITQKDDVKKKQNENILKITCCSDICECQQRLESPSFEKIEKIIVKEVGSTMLEEIFLPNNNDDNDEENKENKNDNINKQFNDVIIKNCNLENVNLAQIFPNVNKFKLKKCTISFDSKEFFNFNKIKELYLENIGLVNESFNSIFSDLKNNIEFINNIKIFSIKNNNISILNLNFEEVKEEAKENEDNNNDTESSKKYNSLEFLNLSDNKISKLSSTIFDLLPAIKVIDITNNNISFYSKYKPLLDSSKEKKCLVLLAKNPGVIKEKNKEEYCNYLNEILPTVSLEYPMKILNLEGLFCGTTYPLLFTVFSNLNLNVISLNLSYNHLNDEDFIKLIENSNSSTSVFTGVKKLILCSNYITEKGLNTLIEGGYNKKLPSVVKLDLSGNPIKLNDFNKFKQFIEGFPCIKTLLLRNTPFEKNYNNYLRVRVVRKLEENQKKELSNMSDLDLKFDEFIEKEHYLREKTKLTLKLMNTNGYKCLSLVRKYFPYLLDNIKIETKFIDEDRTSRL
jgi:hypothetical protein